MTIMYTAVTLWLGTRICYCDSFQPPELWVIILLNTVLASCCCWQFELVSIKSHVTICFKSFFFFTHFKAVKSEVMVSTSCFYSSSLSTHFIPREVWDKSPVAGQQQMGCTDHLITLYGGSYSSVKGTSTWKLPNIKCPEHRRSLQRTLKMVHVSILF